MSKFAPVIRLVFGVVLCLPTSMSRGRTSFAPQSQNEKQPDRALPQEEVDPRVEEMRLAVGRAPDSAEAHNKLGAMLVQTGNLKGGIEEFETAVRLKPDLSKALYNLGVANLSLANTYQKQAD